MVGEMKKKINKIIAEAEKGIKLYIGYKIYLLADVLITPFWVMLILFAILFYARSYLNNPEIVGSLGWGVVLFIMFSSFMWLGNSLINSIQQGILENVIATDTGIATHLFGRAVMSVIDTSVIAPMILLFVYLSFGAKIYIADPFFFVITLILAIIFLTFFGVIYGSLIVATRAANVVTHIMQWTIPFFSGAIPIQFLGGWLSQIMLYSPFFYVIGPIMASITGYYPFDKYFFLAMDALVVIITAILSLQIQKTLLKKTLKQGNFSLF